MKKKYKFNKEWLDLLLEHKNNANITFNLSNNDTRILLTYIEILQQENKQLKDNWNKLKNFITKEYYMYLPFAASTKSITILIDKMKELEGGDVK